MNITEFIFLMVSVVIGTVAYLSRNRATRVWKIGLIFFLLGILAALLFKFLPTDVRPGPKLFQAFLITFSCLFLCGLASMLGTVIGKVGRNDLVDKKNVLCAVLVAVVLTGFTMAHRSFVERATFDPTAVRFDSDYVESFGWPLSFGADLSEDRIFPWSPMDKIRFFSLLNDFLAIFYPTLLAVVLLRRMRMRLKSRGQHR